jgi:hypothetical protein
MTKIKEVQSQIKILENYLNMKENSGFTHAEAITKIDQLYSILENMVSNDNVGVSGLEFYVFLIMVGTIPIMLSFILLLAIF